MFPPPVHLPPAEPDDSSPGPIVAAGATPCPSVRRLLDRQERDARLVRRLIVASACTLLACGVLVYLPAIQRLSTLHERIAADADGLRQARLQTQTIPKVRASVDTLSNALAHLPPLGTSLELGDFIRHASDAAVAGSLDGFEYRPGRVVEEGGLRRMPVVVSFRSDYAAAMAFVHTLEALPRTSRLVDVNVRPTDGRRTAAAPPGQPVRLDVQLTLELFCLAGGGDAR